MGESHLELPIDTSSIEFTIGTAGISKSIIEGNAIADPLRFQAAKEIRRTLRGRGDLDAGTRPEH